MGGLSSTVTNEYFLNTLENTWQKQSHMTWLLLIGLSGGPLFVFARKVYVGAKTLPTGRSLISLVASQKFCHAL